MAQELPKFYDPKETDAKWRKFWEMNRFFTANPASKKPPFCIVMPPPNVTGVLHMGHALVSTLQDVVIRWKRMLGYEALWIPGTDHAGISTQTVVEKHLIRTLGKKRVDFSREEFLEKVWEWKEENEHRIIDQLKKMGASCDWSRKRFTMDPENNQAVRTAFKKMYDEGLIYRGDYLVNWDPVTQTALADDEVEYEERQSFLWYFNYPLSDGSESIRIATTRPETMLGDTGIAVSPQDSRYTHLIGKTARLPLMEREIPIIADHRVDPEFGTGAVKITPAHDPNDYQIGMDHGLPFVNIMTPEGNINENGGKFAGLSMEDGRQAVVAALQELELVEKIVPHTHRVGLSYRSKAVIEPYMSKQWFVSMAKFAPKLRRMVEAGKVELIPEQWRNTYFHWIDNLRDWCISRQLWWGHRIPIWYHTEDPERIICCDGQGLPDEVEKQPEMWRQDPDVLDTWFSSALWPFSTLGWPDSTDDLQFFYPVSVLVTGHDILFFWVARMILMGEYIMSTAPFPEVFLHGLIYGKSYWRDNPDGGITYITGNERNEYDLGKHPAADVKSKWEKMSKSKGNIIDPLEIIDEYGTDAMRMGLCSTPAQSREIDLDRRRFEEFKNFANKMWNGARFVLMNLQGADADLFIHGIDQELLKLEDRWILSVLNRTVEQINQSLQSYSFDQAAMQAYEFFWKEFCAYYVEISKPVLFGKAGGEADRKNKQKILMIILGAAVRLLHPMAPFITEELFQKLKEILPGLKIPSEADPYTTDLALALSAPSCSVARYPEAINSKDVNKKAEQTFDWVCEAVYLIRNIRGEMKLNPSAATDVHIIGSADCKRLNKLLDNKHILQALLNIRQLKFTRSEPDIEFASTGIIKDLKIMIPLPLELLEQEKARLVKEQGKLEKSKEKLQSQLSNQEFTAKAPAQLIQRQKQQMEETEEKLNDLKEKLARMCSVN